MNDMHGQDLISVGEILVDFVAPGADDLVTAEQFIRAAGGAPANVAVAASRLGARSAFVGAVGRDAFGDYLVDVLKRSGVDVTGVQHMPQRTTLAFVAKNEGGIPDFVFYRGADTELSAAMLPHATLQTARIVHASSLPLTHEPSRSATIAAVHEARDAGALISVDPNLRPSSWPSLEAAIRIVEPLIVAADILKVNEEEARVFSGRSDLDGAADSLTRAGRVLVVVTLGAQGCMWRWKGHGGSIAAPAIDATDSTGAGDAFLGALLAEIARHGYTRQTLQSLSVPTLEESLRFAVAAGAIACLTAGAMPSLPVREQVERLIATRA
ncbi:MAG: carbohydrate kinase [Chloroflexota bacterium]